MAITKVFSTSVLVAASIIAMIISCFTPLIKVIYGIPLAVIGGLEVYLFGAIAAQGIAIMIDKNVDMFSSKNIAVIAVIMVVGLADTTRCWGSRVSANTSTTSWKTEPIPLRLNRFQNR